VVTSGPDIDLVLDVRSIPCHKYEYDDRIYNFIFILILKLIYFEFILMINENDNIDTN
jgi:hypothetical protein